MMDLTVTTSKSFTSPTVSSLWRTAPSS